MRRKSSTDKNGLRELQAFEAELQNRSETTAEELTQLKLRFEALWELVREHLSLPSEALDERLQSLAPKKQGTEIREDAIGESAAQCEKCGRPLLKKTGHCAFCGADEETIAKALKQFEHSS